MDANQGIPGGDGPATPPAPTGHAETPATDASPVATAVTPLVDPELARAEWERRNAADALSARLRIGLTRWFVFAVAGSVLAAWLGHPDAAVLLALAAAFGLAQSWDQRDRAVVARLAGEPALEPGAVGAVLRVLVPLAVPVLAALGYVALGVYAQSLPPSREHLGAMRWCWAAAAACMAMTIPAL